MKPVRVAPLRPGPIIDEPVAGQSRPVALSSVFVGLKLDQEERDAGGFRIRLAPAYEVVCTGVFACRIVEQDHVAPVGIEEIIGEKRQEQQAAGAASRELHDVGQFGVMSVAVDEGIRLVRDVSDSAPSTAPREGKPRGVNDGRWSFR